MSAAFPPLLAVGTEYAVVAIFIGVAIGFAAVNMVLTHLIGPKRKGAVKDGTYESGVTPFGDARRRFNVRFYIVAMLFLLFDVEIVFFYPWAVLYPRLTGGSEFANWAAAMKQAGFGSGFFLVEMLIFVAILAVGYVYAWRKGVFKWA